MVLTLATLAEEVRQELGRTPARSTSEALVNEAGEAWVNAHSWKYLRDRRQEISLVVGTEDYRLALGVRDVRGVLHRKNSVWHPIPLIDYESFTTERERFLSEVNNTFTPLATLRWDTLDGDTQPRLYLQVYPATLTETVQVQYQAGWLPLDLADDVADIPPPLEQPFKEWVRRYALGREKMPSFSTDAALQTFFGGPAGYRAKTVDAQHVNRIVPAPGAVGARMARSRARRDGFAGGDWYDRYRITTWGS